MAPRSHVEPVHPPWAHRDEQPVEEPVALLAVDVGLRIGLAAYSRRGRLRWYRSQHLANRSAMKRLVEGLIKELPELERVVLEGGGPLAEVWRRPAERRGLAIEIVAAEHWREDQLLPRQRTSGSKAKSTADDLARAIIQEDGTDRPKSLRHDAAEAIVLGRWAVRQLGWRSDGREARNQGS